MAASRDTSRQASADSKVLELRGPTPSIVSSRYVVPVGVVRRVQLAVQHRPELSARRPRLATRVEKHWAALSTLPSQEMLPWARQNVAALRELDRWDDDALWAAIEDHQAAGSRDDDPNPAYPDLRTPEWEILAARRAMVGDFAAARHANDAARRLGERAGDVSLTALSDAFSSQLSILRGDPAEMPTGWEEAFTHAPAMPIVQLSYPVHHALAGDLDLARAEFAEFRHLPETYPYGVRWAGTIGMVALAAVLLEDTEVAATVYPQLLDTAHYYSSDGSGGVFSHGANTQILGELARVTGRTEDALTHYAEAVAMNTRVGARPFNRVAPGWTEGCRGRSRRGGARPRPARRDQDRPPRSARRTLRSQPQPGPRRSPCGATGERESSEREVGAHWPVILLRVARGVR